MAKQKDAGLLQLRESCLDEMADEHPGFASKKFGILAHYWDTFPKSRNPQNNYEDGLSHSTEALRLFKKALKYQKLAPNRDEILVNHYREWIAWHTMILTE